MTTSAALTDILARLDQAKALSQDAEEAAAAEERIKEAEERAIREAKEADEQTIREIERAKAQQLADLRAEVARLHAAAEAQRIADLKAEAEAAPEVRSLLERAEAELHSKPGNGGPSHVAWEAERAVRQKLGVSVPIDLWDIEGTPWARTVFAGLDLRVATGGAEGPQLFIWAGDRGMVLVEGLATLAAAVREDPNLIRKDA